MTNPSNRVVIDRAGAFARAFTVKSRVVRPPQHLHSDHPMAETPAPGFTMLETWFGCGECVQLLVPLDAAADAAAVPRVSADMSGDAQDPTHPRTPDPGLATSWYFGPVSQSGRLRDAAPSLQACWTLRRTRFSTGGSVDLLVPLAAYWQLMAGDIDRVLVMPAGIESSALKVHYAQGGVVVERAVPGAGDAATVSASTSVRSSNERTAFGTATSVDKLAVDASVLDRLDDQPPAGSLHVWAVSDMRERIRVHNSRALGDRDWRERDQALLREALTLGPERRIHLPSDEQVQAVCALRTTFGEFAPAIDHVLLRMDATPGATPAPGPELAATAPGRFPPLLLVGPPGIGKSHFVRALSEALGLPMYLLDASAGAGRTDLFGVDRRWANSETGLLWRILAQTAGAPANPMLVVDEIDKCHNANADRQHEMTNGLLGLLEPSTARFARERCLDLPLDASVLNWVFTANTLRGIPRHLLSRMTLMLLEEPTIEQRLAKTRAIASQIAQRLGVVFARDLIVEVADMQPRALVRCLEDLARRARRSGRQRVALSDLLRGGPPTQH